MSENTEAINNVLLDEARTRDQRCKEKLFGYDVANDQPNTSPDERQILKDTVDDALTARIQFIKAVQKSIIDSKNTTFKEAAGRGDRLESSFDYDEELAIFERGKRELVREDNGTRENVKRAVAILADEFRQEEEEKAKQRLDSVQKIPGSGLFGRFGTKADPNHLAAIQEENAKRINNIDKVKEVVHETF